MATGSDPLLPADESADEVHGPDAATGSDVIHDPTIKALIDAGPRHFMTRRQKIERYLLWVIVVAVVALTAGYFAVNGIAHQARSASDRANTSVQAQCKFYHDIAAVPPAPTSSLLGLTILADARIAYDGLGCSNGMLAPADPRVAALLPPGVR